MGFVLILMLMLMVMLMLMLMVGGVGVSQDEARDQFVYSSDYNGKK